MVSTVGAVVGVDIGSESTKCVLGSAHDFEVVRNAHGGHSTPSTVQFRGRARLAGEDACEAKNANADTVLHVGRLVESVAADEDDALAAFYRFDRTRQENGSHDVSVEYDGERKTFTSTAVLAMLLGKVRKCVEDTVARKLGDDAAAAAASETKYVLAMPPCASDEAKAAVRDAAFAAGCGDGVEIVSAAECTAAVYGRKFADDADDVGKLVLVVDMGHAQTTASILRLGGNTATNESSVGGGEEDEDDQPDPAAAAAPAAAELLSSASNASLGAACVDVKLWQYFKGTVPGLASLTPDSRRGQRLLDGCRRLKHLLSMLPSGSVTVETLGDDDKDVTLTATREKIHELCSSESDALAALIAKVIEGADGIESTTDIASVEALGGGCRIPFVKNAILRSIGRSSDDMTLSHSLDDTSVAMGAALLGEDGTTGDYLAVDEEKRKCLFEAEQAMMRLDAEVAMLADARNKIESHVLEMRSARHGKHGSLLPEELDAHLTKTDDWLFSEECDNADLDQMNAKLEEVLAKSNEMCAVYYEAVSKEAEMMEKQMKEEAERAKAEREAAGEDDEDHDNRRLPKKRRMEIVMKNKQEANELFAGKNYKHAAARYVKALSHCAKFHDLGPEDQEEVNGTKLSLNLNLALAYFKLEKYDNALRACNEALAIDGDSTKALFRRASVYYEMKKFEDAKSDLNKALMVAPDDVALKKLNARIEQQIKKQKVKEKKMAQKMFG
mmetsp:Transcript_1190/g.2102  ORF Transcript_1190/g.2102 Transcript_1190/m.2102 type:complete len:730 (+) Transcript_1190:311-2500(+)